MKAVSSYCFYTTIIVSVIIVILGLVFLSPIVNLLGADSDNAEFTKDYLQYIFLGTPFLMLGGSLNNIFRSAGLIRQSTVGLVIGNLTNIILDYIFIIQLDMATAGAAIATSLGFLIQTVYYVVCMVNFNRKNNQLLPLSPKAYKPTIHLIGNVLAIGIPGALITVLISVTNIIVNNFIGIYGSNVVASYGIAFRLNQLPILLSVGLSLGVGPLIGYLFGAKETTRLKKAMNLSTVYGVVMGVFLMVFFISTGRIWVRLFLEESSLVNQAVLFLNVLCLSAPILGVINMVTSYFQAVGKPIQSLIITLGKNFIIFIPAIILLNTLFALNGVIAALPITEYIIGILCIVLYKVDIRNINKLEMDPCVEGNL